MSLPEQRESAAPSNGNGVSSSAPATSSVSTTLASTAPVSLHTLSALVDRIALFQRHGFSSHDGARDLFDALGFKSDLTLSDYRAAYRRGGIAKQIIDFFPRETWRGGVFLIENEDPDTVTAFESQWEEFRDRLSLIKTMRMADRLARLGEYSCVLIGTSKRGELSTPLPRGTSPSQIIYLPVYAQDRAVIRTRVKDPSDPRWGLPETYTLKVDTGDGDLASASGSIGGVLGGGITLSTRDVVVHWTRILHACHDALESETHAPPMLEAPYNDIYSLWKLVWGGAETSWRNARRFTVANLDGNPAVQFSPDYVEKLEEKLIEAQHGLKDNMIVRGTTMSVLGGPVDKFDANGNFLLDLIGGTVQIQKRNLLGSEKVGELASGLDRKRNADAITSMQEGFADPLIRDLVTRLIDFGYFSAPMKKSKGRYEVLFSLEDEMSEDEKADYAAKIASANKDQKDAEGKVLRTSNEIRDYLWGAEPLEDPEEVDPVDPVDPTDPAEVTDPNDPQKDQAVDPKTPGTQQDTTPTVNEGARGTQGSRGEATGGHASALKAAKLRLQKKRVRTL